MRDADTKTGFRLYDGSPVLQPSDLDAFYPGNGYRSRLLAAMLGALPRSDKMFVVDGYDKMWNALSNDIGCIWSLSKRRGHFIAICMMLDDRRPHKKKLRLLLYDPQQVTNDAHRAFATCRVMDKLDSHARQAGTTRWRGIRHIGKVHLVISSEVEDSNCCGPRVLEYALQSNPFEEPAALMPGMPLSTSTLRKGHFALLRDILEGRIPELEL
ncbi:hypothetical protein LTR99_005757 [Exophiala xenobiotica]|nr:hypothetical protein LTR96_004874 [Exophiala xenobiotica]KAK5549338.1 hypothetical protein LTR23_000446 [Chaetothyriales sp. CCFEE 6169]KAK5302800.1 hypothetical protein LTR99_005757 [Exophiala xenobiotica]KAK5340494.1 hypothetical protein LTR98_003616 [Exophiala xenobiotica]KAK5382401.1 hypothetical protein LTS13_003065 [Exophiala xenobiotica]